jgi:hypothetical protein
MKPSQQLCNARQTGIPLMGSGTKADKTAKLPNIQSEKYYDLCRDEDDVPRGTFIQDVQDGKAGRKCFMFNLEPSRQEIQSLDFGAV